MAIVCARARCPECGHGVKLTDRGYACREVTTSSNCSSNAEHCGCKNEWHYALDEDMLRAALTHFRDHAEMLDSHAKRGRGLLTDGDVASIAAFRELQRLQRAVAGAQMIDNAITVNADGAKDLQAVARSAACAEFDRWANSDDRDAKETRAEYHAVLIDCVIAAIEALREPAARTLLS